MAKGIYRHIKNDRLYTIVHILIDVHSLSRNVLYAGIYATPYKSRGDKIRYIQKDHQACTEFVKDNFTLISE